jgi:hypothetical protein
MPADPTAALALAEEVLALDEKATPGPWHETTGHLPGTDRNGMLRAMVHDPSRKTPDGGYAIASCGPVKRPDSMRDAILIARYRTLAPEIARALREAVERAKQAEAERDLMRDAGRRLCDNGAVNMHEDGCDETADECACEALRDLRLICNDSDAPGSARAALAEAKGTTK